MQAVVHAPGFPRGVGDETVVDGAGVVDDESWGLEGGELGGMGVCARLCEVVEVEWWVFCNRKVC